MILTTIEAARRLGVTERMIRHMCEGGDLKAMKLGRTWIIDGTSVERAQRRAKRGGK